MSPYSSALGLSIAQACSATGKNHERASNTPLIVLIRSEAFCRVSGLDERYPLYLQDAVLGPILDRYGGRCVHLSVAAKVHCWGPNRLSQPWADGCGPGLHLAFLSQVGLGTVMIEFRLLFLPKSAEEPHMAGHLFKVS